MKFTKQFIFIVISIFAVFSITGCSMPLLSNGHSSGSAIPYTSFSTKAATTDEILQVLIRSMERNETTCELHISDESLINAENWLKRLAGIGQIHCEYRKVRDGFNVVINLQYWDSYAIVYAYKTQDTSYLNSRQTELYNKYLEVIDDYTSPSRSDCANELSIHDYLVAHIVYEEQEDTIYNAYDAMIKGKSVCSGYTEAFKTFMDILGIENAVLTGTAGDQQHVWNMVKLDDEWYQVDVTWDDSDESDAATVDHSYFNLTDADMALDHTWDLTQNDGLKAAGTKYSYPNYAGLTNITSQTQFNSYMTACINGRVPYLEFTSAGTVDLKTAIAASDTTLSYSYKIAERTNYTFYIVNLVYDVQIP